LTSKPIEITDISVVITGLSVSKMITDFTIYKFKFLKNHKKLGKYYKKLEKNLSTIVKKKFQIYIIWLVKIQILSNIAKGAHMA
jgi:hypothetical protein